MQDQVCGLGVSVSLRQVGWVARSLWPLSALSSSRPGRTSFYEEYGIIRDVLQNHLTEILTLVAMELPYNVSSAQAVLQHKLQAFQALRGLRRRSAVLGQYQAYREQVCRELHKPPSFHSLTPTFAGGCWGWARTAGGPRPEAGFHAQTPFGWGCRELKLRFSQSETLPRLLGLLPRLPGLPPT